MTHCVSHRVELAVKDALKKEKAFSQVQDLMIVIYYLMKQSGKFKRHFHETAKALGVQVYNFPKLHGTRFVRHQRNGVTILLHNLIPLAQAIENSMAQAMHKPLNAKLRGILKKLQDAKFLVNSCLFKEILEIISGLSLRFEKGELQAFEVPTAVELTESKLQDLLEEEDVMAVTMDKAGFTLRDGVLSIDLPKGGHMRRSVPNREYTTLALDMTGSATDKLQRATDALKDRTLPALKDCLETRFSSFNSQSLFQDMMWVDPANWRSDTAGELESMNTLAQHFEVPLAAAGLQGQQGQAGMERCQDPGQELLQRLWEQILCYRKANFPNICLLVELVLSVGVSNSTVEGGFSILTAMLSDCRLSLNHSTMENLMLIKANHLAWSERDRDEIIDDALEHFLSSKRRVLQLDTTPFGALGVQPQVEHNPKRHQPSLSQSANDDDDDQMTDDTAGGSDHDLDLSESDVDGDNDSDIVNDASSDKAVNGEKDVTCHQRCQW